MKPRPKARQTINIGSKIAVFYAWIIVSQREPKFYHEFRCRTSFRGEVFA